MRAATGYLVNRLKPLITEDRVTVNIKYGPSLEVGNYARFFMFSNNTVAPLSLEEGDRRFFVVECEGGRKDDDFYRGLNAFADSDEGKEAIHRYLMARDISAFNPFAPPPMTGAKRRIVEETSGNPLAEFITGEIHNGKLTGTLGVKFTGSQLQEYLHKAGQGALARNNQLFAEATKLAGLSKRRERTPDGKQPWVYAVPEWAAERWTEQHGGDGKDF